MVKVKDELRKRLIESTPKPYQSRAQSLFQFIENKMALNEKGEMTDNDGAIIHGSNIADLVQHAVRDRRRNILPTGWSHFINILRDSNAPRMIMIYETLQELHTSKGATTSVAPPFKFTATKPQRKRIKLKRELMEDTSKPVKSTRAKRSPSRLRDYLVTKAKQKKYV